MRRRAVLLLVAMAAALVLVSGVAYALTIQCDAEGDQNPEEGECFGTSKSDNITGTSDPDVILSFGGNDRISALGGNDSVASADRRDRVFLDGGNDIIDGEAGNDEVFAADNRKDKIDCGEGEADIVHYDHDIDRISNCETQVVEIP